MLSAAVVSSTIVLISLFLGIALLVAWREFRLERHVVYWALSFMASAVGHGLRISGSLLHEREILFAMLACHASVASFGFLAWGFRRRAGRGTRLAAACWAIATIFLIVVWIDFGPEWRTMSRIATAVADAVMVAIIVATLRTAKGNAAIIVRWLLSLYVVYIASVGVFALLARSGGEVDNPVFIMVLSIGTPTGMIGTGILTLLIVAADLARELRYQARRDPLTGLLNRRGLEEDVTTMLLRDRSAAPLAVVVADLDLFKSINDKLGHAMGDEVLRRFAGYLNANLGSGEIAARTGGEEFVALMPATDARTAIARVEAIRESVPAAFEDITRIGNVTASFGIALARPGESFQATLARADAALYASKHAGRDRVMLEG